jgi:hypothetical protein
MPLRPVRVDGRVVLGDGRALQPQFPTASSFDLALFSPPYPNNIDYTEVYKLEAWLLGYIADAASFADQRRLTLYSHPSILRPEALRQLANSRNAVLRAVADPVLATIPADRYTNGRKAMIAGYLVDVEQTMRSCFRALRPGGRLVYVVGNSLHGAGDGSFVIAADLLIAQIAESVGFNVDAIRIARQLRRRSSQSPFLRESVVFARRPAQSNGSGAA